MASTPIKLFYDPELQTLYNADGSSINKATTPKIALTQKSILNISLVTKNDEGNLISYTDLPISTAGEFLVDNDYSNPALTLQFGVSGWIANNPQEYKYFEAFEEPSNVQYLGNEMISGIVGSLSTDEWGYDGENVNIRLNVDPNTTGAGDLTYDYDTGIAHTPLFIFSSEFNETATWQDDDGSYRNPDIAQGELSFNISANTQDFYTRLGNSASKSDTFAQIHLYSASEIFMTLQFNFTCNNILLNDENVNLELVGINYYTKTEVDSLIQDYIPLVSGAVAGNAVALHADGTLVDVGFAPGAGASSPTVKVDANDPTADYLSGKFNSTQFESVSTGYYMQVRDGGLEIANIDGLSAVLSAKVTTTDADSNYMPQVLSGLSLTTSLAGSEIIPLNTEDDELKTINAQNFSDFVIGNIEDFDLQNGIYTPSNGISNVSHGISITAQRDILTPTTDHLLLLHFDGSIGDGTFIDDGYYSESIFGINNPTIDATLDTLSGYGSYLKLDNASGIEVTAWNMILSGGDWSMGCKFLLSNPIESLSGTSQTIFSLKEENNPVLNVGLRSGYLEYKIGVNNDTDWTNEDSVEVLDTGYLRYGNSSELWNSLLFQQIGNEIQLGLNGNVLARISMTNKVINTAENGLLYSAIDYDFDTSGYIESLSGAIDEITLTTNDERLVFITPHESTPKAYEDRKTEVNVSKKYDIGPVIGSGSYRIAFTQSSILTDGVGDYILVPHNLSERLLSVSVLDNNYYKIIEDDVIYSSFNSCKVYLTNYTPLTDTWSIYVESGN